jgi:indole-3-glycerol phosphate synthase
MLSAKQMDILKTIVQQKKAEVKERASAKAAAELEKSVFFSRNTLSLADSLRGGDRTGIIAEYKRRSPSKGVINEGSGVEEVTLAYTAHGASGLSVLTDERFFGAVAGDLQRARINEIPLLRKDFIIDEFQVLESRAMGADVVLLIAACLSPLRVRQLASLARQLGMEVLLEIHDEAELGHVCDDTHLVGVNNRDLRTFEVDINRSIALGSQVPPGKVMVAESGIRDPETVNLLQQFGFKGFLVGEQFMKSKDPGEAFRQFAGKLKSEKQNKG